MTTGLRVASNVEGHGEVKAVPILIRRIAQNHFPHTHIDILRPFRAARTLLTKPGQLESYVELATRGIGPKGSLLIILDGDEDCPAELGPELLERARSARSDLPLGVVLAKCEFEAWFLAAAESLRGLRGLPADLPAPADSEKIRGAKEWLSRRLPPGRVYTATADQAAFTAMFDLELAKRASSFEKCYREIIRLLSELSQRAL